jgi:hypothetical protein
VKVRNSAPAAAAMLKDRLIILYSYTFFVRPPPFYVFYRTNAPEARQFA